MSAPINWFKGIHDLAFSVAKLGQAGHSVAQKDSLATIANTAAGLGKFMWYLKDKIGPLAQKLTGAEKAGMKTPTYIIDIAMVSVAVVDLFGGFGSPNRGECFRVSQEQLDNVDTNLDLATPGRGTWEGAAAEAYAAQVRQTRDRVQELKVQDAALQGWLADHGNTVQTAHTTLAFIGLGLVGAQGIALALFFLPAPYGPAASYTWQVGVAASVAIACLAVEGQVGESSSHTAGVVSELAAQYRMIAEKAPLSATFAKIAVPGADESTVANFKAISESLSDMPAMPNIGPLASMAGADASTDHRDLLSVLSALTGDGEDPADGVPAEPETPVETLPYLPSEPSAPAWTPPTPAQLSAMAGQAGQISGQLSQHMNLLNQTVGQAQQVGSAHQSQGVGAPANEDAHAGDDGAAAGAGNAERAPIDAATVASEQAREPQAQQPRPAERTV